MRAEYKDSWQRIKSRALVRIAEHGDSWSDWCQAKTDEDRELLIIEAVWHLAYEASSNKKMINQGEKV